MIQSTSRRIERMRNLKKQNDEMEAPSSIKSPKSSRDLLKDAISQRRESLSRMEHDVLEDLCENGSERDTAVAHVSLLSYETKQQNILCSSSLQGSTRRQLMLNARKAQNSAVWKAHETTTSPNAKNRLFAAVLRAKMAFTRKRSSMGSDPGARLFPKQLLSHRAVSAGTPRQMMMSSVRSVSAGTPRQPSTSSCRRDSSTTSLSTQEEVPPPIPSRHTLARKASVNNYYRGEGFEIGFVELSSSDCDDDEIRDSFDSRRDLSMHREQEETTFQRPVLMKRASIYSGEGMEVADWDSEWQGFHHHQKAAQALPILRSHSFDQSMSYERSQHKFTARLRRSASDSRLVESADETFLAHIQDFHIHDCWISTVGFSILGTNANDTECHPHVLSPPMMQSLRDFFPSSRRGENMWLRYSLVRDGASIHSFLDRAKGSQCSLLSIETVDGEVFGCFTCDPWHRESESYGNGQSFLWRYRHNRHQKTWSVLEQANMESEVDVYPLATGSRPQVQLCTETTFGIGGLRETFTPTRMLADGTFVEKEQWGFGLCITGDVLLEGTTSPCYPFLSPALSQLHADGSRFEIVNIELWTTTPCLDEVEAERLELKHLFLREHMRPLR